MKKIFTFILFLFGIMCTYAQVININPDPNGEPWLVGGLRIPTDAELSEITTLKNLEFKNTKELPSSLDNSEQIFFRPVFNQQDGSCAQASGVAYTFTYEINRIRNTNASVIDNQYPSHYTYNFLNNGSGSNGSVYLDGWDIIASTGCPNVTTYGDLYLTDTYWMSGYEKYVSGMSNRVSDIFAINVSTPEGLITLKNWLENHLEDAQVGGIVNFSAGVSDEFTIDYDGIISHFGHTVNHAMTIVGWDDNIEYDFNNDGFITNNIDINNDDVIDMKDWEKGALVMVNSWGQFWGNSGKAYIMYKLLAEPVVNGGIMSGKVFSIHVKETFEPLLVMKAKIEYNDRNNISIKAGVSNNLDATEPDYIIDFPLFNFQGGNLPMNGNDETPLELALDITPLLSYIESNQNVKFFLGVKEIDLENSGGGQIEQFIIEDVLNNTEISSNNVVAIENNATTWYSITGSVEFDSPQINTSIMPYATANENYSHQLTVSGGEAPYKFNIKIDYTQDENTENYPLIISNQLTPTSDDDGVAPLTLDFDFPFYGKTYNEIVINTDGSIIFMPEFEFLRTEEAVKKTKMIAIFASDLMYYSADNDGIFYEGNSDYAIIRWKSSLFDNQEANIDVAIKLYPSGEIDFYYGNDIIDGLPWVAGISNGDFLNYKFYSNSSVGNPQNSTFKFIPEDFPLNMEITEDGIFQGIVPNEQKTWYIDFVVTDNKKISDFKTIQFSSMDLSVIENIDNKDIICYPNPFKNYVNIAFELDTLSVVSLNIFDLSGKMVANIIEAQNLISGKYNYQWNLQPDMQTGIYLYKLQVGNKKYTGKIIKE